MSPFNLGFLAALALTVLLPSGCTVSISRESGSSEVGSSGFRSAPPHTQNIELMLAGDVSVAADSSPIRGGWSARGNLLREISTHPDRPIQMRIQRESAQGIRHDDAFWIHEGTFHVDDNSGSPGSDARQITMQCELSTARLLFNGERHRDAASGSVEIIPDKRFVQRGRELLDGELTVEELLRFGLQPAPLDYIQLISAQGNRWTWAEALQLQQRGLSPEFVLALRQAPTATEQPLPPDRGGVREARKPFRADDLVLLHMRGVSADYVEKLDAAGTSFNANDIVLLHMRGVSTGFVAEIVRSGLSLNANDLVLLSSRGVPLDYIREIQEVGYRFEPNDFVFLHSRGVPAGYARELRNAGYRFSSNDLILLHSRGVPASYASAIADSNYALLTAQEVLRLHTSGVPVETVKRLRK